MGQILPFSAQTLVMAILISRPQLGEPLLTELRARFGAIAYRSAELAFAFTHYYDGEMGTPITRFFVSFDEPVDPGKLAHIKIETNRLESRFSESGLRKVNLDPGLLSGGRFILASTKDGLQRIPLSRGIYAEVTLVYRNGSYRPLEWTYPDYRSREYLDILEEIRQLHLGKVRGG
jgi:hypothetical protein